MMLCQLDDRACAGTAAAPASDVALSPGSQPFDVAAGPVSSPIQAQALAPAPEPAAFLPPEAEVATVFRLALIGDSTIRPIR